MKLYKYLPILLLVIVCAVVSIACSNGKSPVEPSTDDPSGISSDLPASSIADPGNRSLLAVYDAVIDPASKTFTITPDARSAQYHFALTQMYPNVLKITGYGFTPNLWADIKLVHPYPGSGIKGYDPRVIAILPANPGVRFIYPVMGIGGNNAVVLEPDGYTKLFDSLGGSIPGNVNPFKAYFKDQPYRVWSGTGVTEETQRWQMNIAGFGGPLQFKLVVDVSTNYPNPPQPIIDNAQEPVEIDAMVGLGLTPIGGSAPIEVRLKHWKDISEIGGVLVESPDLFDSTRSIQYYSYSPYYGASIFKGTLENEKLAQQGTHDLMVKSWHNPSGIEIFSESSANVSGLTGNGSLNWAKRAGGLDHDGGSAITTLSDNSTVVVGFFSGSATFGPGEPNETVLSSGGLFIARYNPDGTLMWAKENGVPGGGITTLSDNSIVVTGNGLIARYNPDGTLIWVKEHGGISNGIITLTDNSTVVTGYFGDPATFGPGEINQTVLTSFGRLDIFIARYNPDGTLAWAKSAGGTETDVGYAVTTLSDNSTVVTGNFEYSSATFGPGEVNETVLTPAGTRDTFIARYNPNGTLVWAKQAGGVYHITDGFGITTLSDNSPVVTGCFTGSVTFGPGEINESILTSTGESDIFIAQYNPDGTLVWVKHAGGVDYDGGLAITPLSDDSIVITGTFGDLGGGSAIFGEGESNETVLDSVGSCDVFIARYNSDGILAWAKHAGGLERDLSFAVTSLSDDSTVATGQFRSSATFGPLEVNETILTSAGREDIFIARFAP